jgi:hypothetical protein
MKKKILIATACLATFAMFMSKQQTPENASDLAIDNVEAIGLSAAEAKCDGKTTEECSVEIKVDGNQTTLRGHGNPVYIF